MRIIDQLIALADIWSEANSRSKARLGTIVANDGNFFVRIEASKNCNTNTVEKFLTFFRDGRNWKDGRIPNSAVGLLDRLDSISTEEAAAGGKLKKITAKAGAC